MAMWTGSVLHWIAVLSAIGILFKLFVWFAKPKFGIKTTKWITDNKGMKWLYLGLFLLGSWYVLIQAGINIIEYTVVFMVGGMFYIYFLMDYGKELNSIAKSFQKKKLNMPAVILMVVWAAWILWYLFY